MRSGRFLASLPRPTGHCQFATEPRRSLRSLLNIVSSGKISEGQRNEKSKDYLFRAYYSKRVRDHSFPLGRDSEAGRGVGEFRSGRKGKDMP